MMIRFAINNLSPVESNAHLVQCDPVHGCFLRQIKVIESDLVPVMR